MYFKIIFNNVRKNIKDYSIYFLTLMIAVALFYAFNSLDSQTAFKTATSDATSNLSRQLISVLSVLSKFIAFILAFLIIYANNYLLKRRKKELGIYMLLGMENRSISGIFVGETILIGIFSFISGIAIGCLLSQGVSAIALKMFAIDLSQYRFVFSISSLINTLICFSIIFIVVIIFNVRTVAKVKLIDLLNAGRKNENFAVKSKKALAGILFVGLCMLAIVALLIYKKNGAISNSAIFSISFVLGILGTACIMYSFFGVLFYTLQKNVKWYFKDVNVFLIRQISAKIQTNYLTITIVCLLLAATICIVSTGMGIALSLNSNAADETPYDFIVLKDLENKKADKSETFQQYFSKKKVDLNEYLKEQIEISIYEEKTFTYNNIIADPDKLFKADADLLEETVPIISISDYNKILESQGKDKIDLKESTYLINCKYRGTKELLQSFVESNKAINIAGRKLTPEMGRINEVVYYLSSVGNNDHGTIVVSDKVIANLNKTSIILNGIFKEDSNKQKFDNLLVSFMGDPQSPYQSLTKTLVFEAYYGMFAMAAFVCCYIGIIFLIICVAILSLQQLTETFDNVYRYNLLQKLGVEKKLCYHTILKQIAIYFGAPLMLASIYSIVALPSIISKASVSLGLDIGVNVGYIIVLLLIIYGGYFLVTYFSCRNMINGK
ncbi:FtsX-like permease family protein [Pseudobacteroides cellulosolvens]|uniref:ABC3 transporter permease C-terminal domain-containing protein n=1 Tax=Pseudobacteroides cellulosolvens ATCC 35603 = DSM 2933 TaxID=398512 RepID=A0A0L6JSX3_9FIRM|nr:ABC transporter permease [Pseudobacteroides cellulosolvens]KNY28946.1 protein of unknown function DUF214 [Pseudobacteroides cellulosolvens ATCC 35603 = DSM 2933]